MVPFVLVEPTHRHPFPLPLQMDRHLSPRWLDIEVVLRDDGAGPLGQRLQSCFERLQSQFLTEVTGPGGTRTLAAPLNLALVACDPLHLRFLVFEVIQFLIGLEHVCK